jgi:gluconate 2-dehydrogenase subunit 3-like protein
MSSTQISRRDVIRTLTVGAASGSVLSMISLQAAEHVHKMIKEDKSKSAAGSYVPKFFTPHQYKTLQTLCQTIIPADSESGGAIEAGAPEFIDLLTSENEDYQLKLGGGLMWLDSTCRDRFGQVYLECSSAERMKILDLIAFRESVDQDQGLTPGIQFFAFLRNLTADGFFTSKIGIEYLKYIGNEALPDFAGCPPLPGP